MHPRLLLTAEPRPGLRSLAEVRASLTTGHPQVLWEHLKRQAEEDLRRAPYTPASLSPGRDPAQARAANRDYDIVTAAATRIERAALVNLLTGDARFRDEALRQLACVYDEQQWPDWRDLAHLWHPADLRTGQFLYAIGLAYDWLYPALSAEQRQWLIAGLDRRGIQPFLQSLERRAWWAFGEPTNWMTAIVGGAGVTGMALGPDHPASQQLVAEAVPRFVQYLDVLGPEGEFNESIGYASAMRAPIAFFAIHRYWAGGGENHLLDPRFRKFADWYLRFIKPPGVAVPFGDTPIGSRPETTMFAILAAATRTPVYQWFCQQHHEQGRASHPCEELLSYDPTVPAEAPALPRGRAFRAHGACWSSRTTWDPRRTACVVCGKGGHGSEHHGNHDAGTVCIDGYARPLIVDLGCTCYPLDFFGPERYEYYNAAAWGHNIPVFGRRELRTGDGYAATVLDAQFDDHIGAAWLVDTTPLYGGIKRVRRGVIHLLPGVVAVLDCCDLRAAEETSIRWHTCDRAEPDDQGRFVVANDGVSLSGRVFGLAGTVPQFRRGEHAFRAPFDRDRLGNPLPANHESFIEIVAQSAQVRVLTLFSVAGPGVAAGRWEDTAVGWRMDAEGGEVLVQSSGSELAVTGHGHTARLDLEAGVGALC